MAFFNTADRGLNVSALGPDAENEVRRARLEDDVKKQSKDLKREFDNLQHVIKGLEKQIDMSGDKTADLTAKVARVEQTLQNFDEEGSPHARPKTPEGPTRL